MAGADPGSGTRRPAEFSIDRNGVWHYRGSPIQREALVRLLAGMLVFREGRHYLQTPEQLLRVEVEDAPFLIVDMERHDGGEGGACIWCLPNVGDRLRLDEQHPLVMKAGSDGMKRPYVHMGEGIYALVHRNVFYRMVDMALEVDSSLCLHSAGRVFPLE